MKRFGYVSKEDLNGTGIRGLVNAVTLELDCRYPFDSQYLSGPDKRSCIPDLQCKPRSTNQRYIELDATPVKVMHLNKNFLDNMVFVSTL